MKNPYIALIFLLLCTAFVANNARATTVVYPTGIFPTDVQNVQAAIDQGGTVLLKATDTFGHPVAFNFGTPQDEAGVNIVNDVSITGELVGSNRTTVGGGVTAFIVFGGRNSITGIKFDAPLVKAISIHGSSGTSIIGNEIVNVIPLGHQPFTIADGIDVHSSNPADVSGNLVISGNTFGDLTGTFSFAIQVDSVAANVTISNNTFQLGQLPTDLGFVNSGAIACIRCHSPVTIYGNTITIGPGLVFAGITVIGDADARYHVFSNTINSQGPFTDGIDMLGIAGDPGPTVAAVIENNTIEVHNAVNFFSGIGLFGAVSNSTIQGNIIRGDAGAALNADELFLGDVMNQVLSNRFLFNNIASATVSGAHIFLGENTVTNLIRGQCVDVIDLGVGNDISCPSPRGNAASIPGVISARQQIFQHALQSQEAVRASITGQSSRR